jgi:hypothetical protein
LGKVGGGVHVSCFVEANALARRDLKLVNRRTHGLKQVINQPRRSKPVKSGKHKILRPINIRERARNQPAVTFDMIGRNEIQQCVAKTVCDKASDHNAKKGKFKEQGPGQCPDQVGRR